MTTATNEKDELLTRMEQAWAELESAWAALTPEQQTSPVDAGGWSAKDHLAHVGTWLWVALARVEGSEESSIFGMDDGTYAAIQAEPNGFEKLNAAAVRLQKSKSFKVVLQETRALHRELVAAVQRLSNDELQRLPSPQAPDRGRLLDQVANNSYEHYQEHLGYLKALLAQP